MTLDMRTIIFRGKSLNNRWVFGDLEVNRLEERTLIHAYDDNNRYHRQFDVRADTVGQFTGIYDKFGTAIYEGDIVRTNKYVTSVIYHEAGFRLQVIDNKKISPLFMRGELEVIGNIYDNEQLV